MEQVTNKPFITVVIHRKTGKLLPFTISETTGEVIILSTGTYNIDEFRVTRVRSSLVDWDNGYYIAIEERKKNGEKSNEG